MEIENIPSTSSTEVLKNETEDSKPAKEEEKPPEIKYVTCESCGLKERYDYFGTDPPFYRKFLILEDAYVIEDPFLPPKQGEILILAAHCIKCRKCVCKDANCSLYFEGTYCIRCAKLNSRTFPNNVQEKLNRIVSEN